MQLLELPRSRNLYIKCRKKKTRKLRGFNRELGEEKTTLGKKRETAPLEKKSRARRNDQRRRKRYSMGTIDVKDSFRRNKDLLERNHKTCKSRVLTRVRKRRTGM